MAKFLHTSDLHINALRRFPAYLSRMKNTLSGILEIAEREEVDFILVAGDVYDRLDIYHEEREVLSWWLASSTVPILLTSGNHDTRSNEIGDTSLSYLSSLNDHLADHIVWDSYPVRYVAWGCNFLIFPYCSYTQPEFQKELTSLLKGVDSDDPVIVVFHDAVTGAVTDRGREVVKRNQVSLIDDKRICYWALGDIHQAQAMLPNAWYCGSPHQVKFDESLEKGVLIVDTNNPTNPKLVPVTSIPLKIVDSPPEKWPSEKEAFVSLRSFENSGKLPSNVEYHTSVHASVVKNNPVSRNKRSVLGVFDGLEEYLVETVGLSEALVPRAMEIAHTFAEQLNLNIPSRKSNEP